MSVSPPPPSKAKIGDVWVDPFDAKRYIFTGENLDDYLYGWKPWDQITDRPDWPRGLRGVLQRIRYAIRPGPSGVW